MLSCIDEKFVPIDGMALAHVKRLNPSLGKMLEKIFSRPEGDYTYFSPVGSDYNINQDFLKMCRVANIGPDTTRLHIHMATWVTPYTTGIGNVFYQLREAVGFCFHFAIPRLTCDFVGQYLDGSTYENFFDFTRDGFFAQKTRSEEISFEDETAILFLPGEFLFRYGVFRKRQHTSETMRFLRNVFTISPDTPYSLNTLVVHIRSGDYFGETRHIPQHGPVYLQPPLHWYKECILNYKKHHPAVNVLLVTVDDHNPCVPAVIAWCRENGIHIEKQSGSIKEDYECLMKAQALIDSRGTFTEMARKLNPHLKILFRFETRHFVNGPYYISGEWTPTPELFHKMISLGEDAFSLPSDLYKEAFCLHRYIDGYIDYWRYPFRAMAAGLAWAAWKLKPMRWRGQTHENPFFDRILSGIEEKMLRDGRGSRALK